MTTCAYTLHQTTTVSNQTSHSPATGVDECAEIPDGKVPGGNLEASPDTQYYNRRRTPPPEYQIGDKVYLDSRDIKTTRPSQKLSHRYLAPFKIIGKLGCHMYKLEPPFSMKRIHLVFNVVKLLHVPPDPIPERKTDPPPPPELIDGEEHYEVEQVLDSRLFRNCLEYLVKWKGYGYKENSYGHTGFDHTVPSQPS
ncbi:hypothetical protein M422DRAFT_271336 [Sphaerobolus stellatus SS14]|uniref:Chromo domain-containing protein n=1 Tax=Sphaerobolus stellatus (strain SS14) TaxID=990650 RepID=A0A0C9TE16_SPHS4|nr:hypothetical protein M422DRAFT_271336 [Sphaerobolus stellatus SS14]